MFYFLLFILSGSVLWALPAGFEQALNDVVEASPAVQMNRARAYAAKAQKEQLRVRYHPQVNFEASYTQTNSPSGVFMQKLGQNIFSSADFAIDRLNDPDFHGDLGGALSVGGLIWGNGALAQMERAAGLRAQAADVATAQTQAQLMIRFGALHFDWAGVKALAEYVAGLQEKLQKDLAESEELSKSGAVLGADLNVAQAIANSLETMQQQLAQRREELASEFEELTGTAYEPKGELELATMPQLEEGPKSRAQQQAALQQQAADNAVKASRKNDSAQLRWVVSQEYHTTGASDGNATTAGVALSMKLFDPTKGKRVAQAKAQQREAEAAAEVAYRAHVRRVGDLQARLETLEGQRERMAQSLELLEQSLGQTQKLYSQGRKSIADVAEIYGKLAQLKVAHAQTKAAYASTQLMWVDAMRPLELSEFVTLFN